MEFSYSIKMTELTILTEFNGEKQQIAIEPSSTLKFFFNRLREMYNRSYYLIANKKLLIFYGMPLKKLFEHNVNSEITLADLELDNNSAVRVEIDYENYITETLLQNPHIVVAQQKELDKYAELKNNENAQNLNESEANKEAAKPLPEVSSYAKEEKKEERMRIFNKIIKTYYPCLLVFKDISMLFYFLF